MDSGLARFVVLVVLFFLLTGDLAGMVKHVFEEVGHGGGSGGGKRQENRPTGPPRREGGQPAADKRRAAADEEDTDDIKEFGKIRREKQNRREKTYLFLQTNVLHVALQ